MRLPADGLTDVGVLLSGHLVRGTKSSTDLAVANWGSPDMNAFRIQAALMNCVKAFPRF